MSEHTPNAQVMEQMKASAEEGYIARHRVQVIIGQDEGDPELCLPDKSDHDKEGKNGKLKRDRPMTKSDQK